MSGLPPPPPTPLPQGWMEVHDPSTGRPYYAHSISGETSWERPRSMPPPPPPPRVPPASIPPPGIPSGPLTPGGVVLPQGNVPPGFQPHQHTPVGAALSVPPPTPAQWSTPNVPHQQYHHHHQTPPSAMAPPVPAAVAAVMSMSPSSAQTASPQTTTPQAPATQAVPTTPSGGTPMHTMLLVPSVRHMINTERTRQMQEQEEGTTEQSSKLEFEAMSAGTIADLCNVSRELVVGKVEEDDSDAGIIKKRQRGKKNDDQEDQEDEVVPYTPLRPFDLPVSARPPHIEPGRVDIRLRSLYSKLDAISS